MNYEVNFGESLNEILFSKNIKPKDFASAIGVSISTVYSWLGNKSEINLNRLNLIAEYFGVSIEFVIGRSYNDSKREFSPMSFPESVKEVLAEKEMTMYRLLKSTQICSKHFQNWKRGISPLLSTLITLSKVLDCTIDHLVGRE